MLVSVSFRWNKMANAKEIGERERELLEQIANNNLQCKV